MHIKNFTAYNKSNILESMIITKLYKVGDKVHYLGEIATIVKVYGGRTPSGQPAYDLKYANNFSKLDSRSNYVRQDLLSPVNTGK